MRNKILTQCASFSSKIAAIKTLRRKHYLTLPLLLLSAFAVNFYASPRIDDVSSVDPDFNIQILGNMFDTKNVQEMIALPDDKILVSGSFTSYNRQPVGGLIRLTADGLLDSTFNNNLIASSFAPDRIYVQSDGKILIAGYSQTLEGSTEIHKLLRLNADGDLDSSFKFSLGTFTDIEHLDIGTDGKILASGLFEVRVNGVTKFKHLVRLNADGSLDETFNFTSSNNVWGVSLQNNKPIVVVLDSQTSKFYVARLNADGSFDNSFERTIIESSWFRDIQTTPDNKILLMNDYSLQRCKENGGIDEDFQPAIISGTGLDFHLSSDGKITYAGRRTGADETSIKRILPNGKPDPTFTTYNQIDYGDFAVQSDGEIFIGDIGRANRYVHLFSDGTIDTAFNSGGIGFQIIKPVSVDAIAVQPDQKIIVAGKIGIINNVNHDYIARLNVDNTIDNSFKINMGTAQNYFYTINNIYTLNLQTDGKIIVTGYFTYVVNGVSKSNVVRLNTDGSIDPTFNLGVFIEEFYVNTYGGKNKSAITENSKIIIASSRRTNSADTSPTRFNSDGSKDSTFIPTFYNNTASVYSYDVAIQPDQKILISSVAYVNGIPIGSLVRLNANGSIDQSFQKIEESGIEIGDINLLPDGKILIVKSNERYNIPSLKVVSRLNANGSPDTTFTVGTGTNGIINEMLVLPTGQILLGGSFTTFNGEARQNLALINADGNLATTKYNFNKEVVSLAIDGQGRVIVGGGFTTIQVNNGQSYDRSYIARLINSPQNGRTHFDFDGDGKSDLSVFRPSAGSWYLLKSSNSSFFGQSFGLSSDVIVPADYDGDGKTDFAVFRPESGSWYLQQSTTGFTGVQFGQNGDIPVPADYDGDGKADIAVYRPSTGGWYRLNSTNGEFVAVSFGAAEDKPTIGDYDGDGKADIAVFRPSATYWYRLNSSDGKFVAVPFGLAGYIQTPADFDGDGKTDIAVFNPSTGGWYWLRSSDGEFAAIGFGTPGDKPVPADYDGDGKADFAVYRPLDGNWYLLRSTAGFTAVQFGQANDKPVPNAFVR